MLYSHHVIAIIASQTITNHPRMIEYIAYTTRKKENTILVVSAQCEASWYWVWNVDAFGEAAGCGWRQQLPHLTQPPFTTDLVSGGRASKAPFANNPAIKTQPRAGNGVDHLLHFCFQKQ